MNKLKKIVLSCFLLIFLTTTFSIVNASNANMQGVSANTQNKYSLSGDYNLPAPGEKKAYGVRVTVVDATTGAPKSTPVDFSRSITRTQVQTSFYKKTKLEYIKGETLRKEPTYVSRVPPASMPCDFNDSIDTVRNWFKKDTNYKTLCEPSGALYQAGFRQGWQELVSGKYKLMIEPIVYLRVKSVVYKTTQI